MFILLFMSGDSGYSIGELSEFSGLTPRALRLLDASGTLVPDRGPNGYRLYSEEQRTFAKAIADMRAAGLTGGEIARIIAVKAGSGTAKDKKAELAVLLVAVETRLAERRKAVDAAIRLLSGYRRALEATLSDSGRKKEDVNGR